MKRLLTGTAIAALLATPALAQTYEADTAVDMSDNTFVASEAELPDEYSAEDLNAIVLAKLEKRPDPNLAMKAPRAEKTAATSESYTTDAEATEWSTQGELGLVETAQGDTRFTTLVSLIELSADDLGLQEGMDYTVFAPVNEAFAPLSTERVDYLTSEEGAKERADILKAHIIPASIAAEDVPMEGTMVETLSGDEVWVMKTDDGTVNVGNAVVVEGNIEASNGIIHAIDTIIMPTSM